nr:MAG TPA: hypothetical protein [Caudoviricetes sp.]
MNARPEASYRQVGFLHVISVAGVAVTTKSGRFSWICFPHPIRSWGLSVESVSRKSAMRVYETVNAMVEDLEAGK